MTMILKHTPKMLLALAGASALVLAFGLSDQSVAAQGEAAQNNGNARLLELDGVVGQVEIRTSPGAAFNVQVIPGAKLSATTERDGITLRVKGPVTDGMRTNCSNYTRNGRRVEEIKLDGVRYGPADLPRIIVTGPSSMGLRIKKSLVSGQAGDVAGATITMIGCGDFSLGNVSRDLELALTGAGDFKVGSIGGKLSARVAGSGDNQTGPVRGNVELDLAGSGNAKIGAVGGDVEINLAGSGDVELAQAQKALEINLAGSGNAWIKAGRSPLSANIAGSGDIRHDGTVINPQVNIIGSGNVTVAKLEGSPRVSKLGSGDFEVR
ncbi:hypothetical protein PbB2_03097 [Candidatus Phycosocius bacilliformis]|uniref:Putative auto-transporter adhesin head GIN domain-containing protein n=1 Tax=Candidatus Phycosocius bacilliformis TaxID=1445552 RepID=A0A2P2EEA4_9PROT|nr:DUF2807 domain-containing protein [Candidatus Phycosocius bacilliformis]GBF59399.1 hypothetical protein PbB2_03097 [Candidatus Phycosocius bacilliformis]